MKESLFISPQLSFRAFGQLSDGRDVGLWTLKGSNGFEVSLSNLGATVTRIITPDKEGRLADVVLGFEDFEGYLDNWPFMGVMAGRVAGRIGRGRFELEGRAYELEINNPPNHLHGGSQGFDKQLWEATEIVHSDGAPSICMRLKSPDGDSGYPGNLEVSVTFSVIAGNVLVIESEAIADKLTPVNLTHHSYFNLSGKHGSDALDHVVQIHAAESCEADEDMTLTGRKISVDGRVNDFRKPKRVGDVVEQLWQKHGDLYWLGEGDLLKDAARVEDPVSGRTLTVQTTNRCLQLYTAESFDGSLKGKDGCTYPRFAGLCFECEEYPDSLNFDGFGDMLVSPGENQRFKTVYGFGVQA